MLPRVALLRLCSQPFFPLPVKLNLEEKQTFYHELGRFVRSGIALPQAVESLAADSRGAMRSAFDRLSELFLGGETTAGAFARLQPAIGSMEVSLIEASDRSGRLEHAFDYLSKYFGTLETVRAGIIKETRWPVVQLHLAAFILSFASDFVSGALGGAGFNTTHFVLQVGVILGIFYGIVAVAVGGGLLLTRTARTSVAVDALLARLPLIGKLRRNMSLGRFCAAYEMQLSAGVNAMDSLHAAGEASQSARVRAEVARMVPEMMAGVSVGTLVVGRSGVSDGVPALGADGRGDGHARRRPAPLGRLLPEGCHRVPGSRRCVAVAGGHAGDPFVRRVHDRDDFLEGDARDLRPVGALWRVRHYFPVIPAQPLTAKETY